MPQEKSKSRNFRFTNSTNNRIERLSRLLEMSDTAIIEEAIAHLLGTLERDQPVWLTSPRDAEKSHKRGPRDAA